MPRNIIQALNRNEILIHATTSVNLENIMLMVEISQTQKAVYCMVLFIENAQIGKSIDRNQMSGCQGLGFRGTRGDG